MWPHLVVIPDWFCDRSSTSSGSRCPNDAPKPRASTWPIDVRDCFLFKRIRTTNWASSVSPYNIWIPFLHRGQSVAVRSDRATLIPTRCTSQQQGAFEWSIACDAVGGRIPPTKKHLQSVQWLAGYYSPLRRLLPWKMITTPGAVQTSQLIPSNAIGWGGVSITPAEEHTICSRIVVMQKKGSRRGGGTGLPRKAWGLGGVSQWRRGEEGAHGSLVKMVSRVSLHHPRGVGTW